MTQQPKALEATPWWVIADMQPPATEPEQPALETVYETIIHWDEGGGKRSRRELARRIAALYTRPQAREPLTDEQIQDAVREADLDWHQGWTLGDDAPNRFVALARAIEAAHGIKENT